MADEFPIKGVGSPPEVYQKMWQKPDSWTCQVCGKDRPDQFIGSKIADISDLFNLTEGTVMQTIRYCLDSNFCCQMAERMRNG